jgi:hypothetical protein
MTLKPFDQRGGPPRGGRRSGGLRHGIGAEPAGPPWCSSCGGDPIPDPGRAARRLAAAALIALALTAMAGVVDNPAPASPRSVTLPKRGPATGGLGCGAPSGGGGCRPSRPRRPGARGGRGAAGRAGAARPADPGTAGWAGRPAVWDFGVRLVAGPEAAGARGPRRRRGPRGRPGPAAPGQDHPVRDRGQGAAAGRLARPEAAGGGGRGPGGRGRTC